MEPLNHPFMETSTSSAVAVGPRAPFAPWPVAPSDRRCWTWLTHPRGNVQSFLGWRWMGRIVHLVLSKKTWGTLIYSNDFKWINIYCLDLFGRVWRSERTVASLLLRWFLVLHWILFAQGQHKVECGIDSFFCWLGWFHCNNIFANMCYRYFLVRVASLITRHGFDNYGGPFLQSAKKGARCLAQQQTKAPARLELEDGLPPPASPPGPDCTNAIDPLEDWKARWTAGFLWPGLRQWLRDVVAWPWPSTVALADLSAKGQTQFMVLAQMGISPTGMVVTIVYILQRLWGLYIQ